ncbi:transcription factor RLM1 [Microdochium nivale]|nr:transcription factor RLM1 [Microdochium nivale]
MANLRSRLRSSGNIQQDIYTDPTHSLSVESAMASNDGNGGEDDDDEDDDDEDDDDEGIPNAPQGPQSSRGSDSDPTNVSLRRPISKRPGSGSTQLSRPAGRASRPSLPYHRGSEVEQKAGKRRKTVHGAYDGSQVPSSPAKPLEKHLMVSRTARSTDTAAAAAHTQIHAASLQADASDNDDEGDSAPPGLLNKLAAVLTANSPRADGRKANMRSAPQLRDAQHSPPQISTMHAGVSAKNGEDDHASAQSTNGEMREAPLTNVSPDYVEIDVKIEDLSDESRDDRSRQSESPSLFVRQQNQDLYDIEGDRNSQTNIKRSDSAEEHNLNTNENEEEELQGKKRDQDHAWHKSGEDEDEDGETAPSRHGPATKPAGGQGNNQTPSEPDDTASVIIDGIEHDDMDDIITKDPEDTIQVFEQDVAGFTDRHEGHETFDIPFEIASGDCFDSAYMRSEDFRQCALLLKGDEWTGQGQFLWVRQSLSNLQPKTTPGRALFSLVIKVERLCAMAPKAPKLTSQMKFLQEHQSMVSHWLSQMQVACQHITHTRLRRPETNALGEDRGAVRKRQEMLKDTMTRIIPMLLHCAYAVWTLAGSNDENAFTTGTLALFEHFLVFAKQLGQAVIRVLVKLSEDELTTSTQASGGGDERTEQARKLVLGLFYAFNEVGRVRAVLAEEGAKSERRREKQKTLLEQMQRNAEATRLQAEQLAVRRTAQQSNHQNVPAKVATVSHPPVSIRQLRKNRFISAPQQQQVPALQGSQPALSSSSSSLSSSSLRREVPSKIAGAKPKTQHHSFREWTREEQLFLLSNIKEAYIAVEGEPRLPDIDGTIRRELNRPLKDILHQTEVLLALMLRKTGEVTDDKEREEWVRRLMSTYRGVALN